MLCTNTIFNILFEMQSAITFDSAPTVKFEKFCWELKYLSFIRKCSCATYGLPGPMNRELQAKCNGVISLILLLPAWLLRFR